MTVFKWTQVSGATWTVITDVESKTIKTLDENSNIILLQENLSKAAIKMLEENFLKIVAEEEKIKFNPMYA